MGLALVWFRTLVSRARRHGPRDYPDPSSLVAIFFVANVLTRKKRERGKGLGKWPRGVGISFNASTRLNCVHVLSRREAACSAQVKKSMRMHHVLNELSARACIYAIARRRSAMAILCIACGGSLSDKKGDRRSLTGDAAGVHSVYNILLLFLTEECPHYRQSTYHEHISREPAFVCRSCFNLVKKYSDVREILEGVKSRITREFKEAMSCSNHVSNHFLESPPPKLQYKVHAENCFFQKQVGKFLQLLQ